jgi:protein phosphatase
LILSGHKSDRGLVRENNEDSYFINDKVGLYVVADGMGGHEGGEIASEIAVKTVGKILSTYLDSPQENTRHAVHEALQKANDEIIQMKKRYIELTSMGTTIVLSIFLNDLHYFTHLGDSRIYLYNKKDELIQLTIDDSLVTGMVKRGIINEEQARTHELRNIVTRYLGAVDLDLPEVKYCHLGVEDCILLCTDGLTGMLEDKEILSIIKRNFSAGPQSVCNALIEQANKNGGADNITVIVIQTN